MIERETNLDILVGTKGTGKTTALQKLISRIPRAIILPANFYDPAWENYDKIVPKKGWIVDPNDFKKNRKKAVFAIEDLNSWDGHKVVDTRQIDNNDEKKSLFVDILNIHGFINGAIVTDDMKNWIPSKGNLPNVVRQALGDMRHKATDFFFATHALNEVNSELLTFCNSIYLFRSNLPPNRHFAEKIGEHRFDELLEMYNRVNQIGAKDGDNPHYCEEFQVG